MPVHPYFPGGGGNGSGSGAVTSVNGEQGDVVLTAQDLQAQPQSSVLTDIAAITMPDNSFLMVGPTGDFMPAPCMPAGVAWLGYTTVDQQKAHLAYSQVAESGSYTDLTNKPTSFPPSAHTHSISDVTGLQTALDNKITTGASIPYATLTGTPTIPTNTNQLTNGSGFITAAQAPVQSVNGQTGVVTLTIPAAQIQSDWNQANTSSLDYIKNKPTIPTVNYPVTSVNTKTGAVVLTNTDVGAAATVHTHVISDVTGLQTALNAKFNTPAGTTSQYLRGDGTTATFPSIPAAQVNSDWNASTSVAQILNKPTTLAGYGITDAVSQSSLTTSLSGYVTTSSLSTTLTGYITNSSLTSTLGGYATTTALTSGLAAKFNVPSGTTGQYVRGDGSLATFPSLPVVPTAVSAFTNDAGYISQSGARTSISLTTTGTSGAATYNSTTGVLNVPTYATSGGTVTIITAGTGLSGGTITTTGTISMPNIGTAGSYNGTFTTDAQGRVTGGTNRSFTNPTRSLNTVFQVSTTQDALVSYAVDITVAALLIGGSSGRVYLEYANEASFTTGITVVTSSGNSTGGVLNITNVGTASLSGVIPAGKYVRIRTVNVTSTPTFTYQSAQEVLLG